MNPLLYKAHPLQYRLVDLFIEPSAYAPADVLRLALIVLGINLLWAAVLWVAVPWVAEARVSWSRAYRLAVPACVVYAPLMLTVLSDVFAHAFQLRDRYILIFTLIVAGHMLAGFYGITVRDGSGTPVGMRAGMALSLVLFLASVPLDSVLFVASSTWGLL